MKFQVQKQELLGAIATVSKALSSRTPNPLLEGVYLSCTDKGLRMMCSDGSLQIETMVKADIQQMGELVLPGNLFFEITRKMPSDEIYLEQPDLQAPNVLIQSGTSQLTLQGFSADEYPQMPSLSAHKTIQISQKALKDMIRQTIFAVSTDEARPILTGVLFETQVNQLRLVALDGYRFAMRTEKTPAKEEFSVVVPASALKEIVKTLADDDSLITLAFSASNLQVDMDETRIHAVLLNGEFMNYSQIFPKELQTTIHINRKGLLDAIERASLMARESKNNLVKFQIQSDSVMISAKSEIGNTQETIPIALSGNELEIAFNARYMLDVLSKLDDEQIVMRFLSNITPCVIEPCEGNAFYFLVLPVRMFNQ